jgi:gliding motility-associated lipoprotein GldJ
MRKISSFVLYFVLVIFLGSCSGTSSFSPSAPRGGEDYDDENGTRTRGQLVGTNSVGKVSPKTGWNYGDPTQGSFDVKLEPNMPAAPGLVLIPGGSFTMGRVQDEIAHKWDNVPRRVTVSSFYMDITEVSNVDYREYLHWINRVFIDYPEVYDKAKPDEMVWRERLAYNEPYVANYFRYPAFNNYPVVGVSWEQAKEYCIWRTDRVNEMQLVKAKILELDQNPSAENNFNTEAYLAGQYEGIVNAEVASSDVEAGGRQVTLEDGILYPSYRLPTEAEWEYAAVCPIATNAGHIENGKIFPWVGKIPRDRRNRFLANFTRKSGDYSGVENSGGDGKETTAPVNSYLPNGFGLYCMAGNVNEWVADVYRPTSSKDVDDLNPYRGNKFMTKMLDEEGNPVEKDEKGRLKYREYTEDELKERDNFRKSDYRDFKDGDLSSVLDYGTDELNEYNKGVYVKRKGDMSFISSRIDNEARVYKGGSWRDRAYWLSPGTRRFLNQKKATNDIGFRCAMTALGK